MGTYQITVPRDRFGRVGAMAIQDLLLKFFKWVLIVEKRFVSVTETGKAQRQDPGKASWTALANSQASGGQQAKTIRKN